MRKYKHRSSSNSTSKSHQQQGKHSHKNNAFNLTLINAIAKEDVSTFETLISYSNNSIHGTASTPAGAKLLKLSNGSKGINWSSIQLNQYKDNLLQYACRSGKPRIVRLLLDSGFFNINERNHDGDTALLIACDCGHTAIARLLIERDVDCNCENRKFKTPLILASELMSPYDIQMCKLLIESGKVLVNYQTENLNNVLLSAAKFGNLELIKYLVSLNVNINSKFTDGATSLARACYYNYYDVVKYFIEIGASIEEKNNRNETPMYIASYRGHIKIVELLIEKNANVNSSDVDGDTPLAVACYEDKAEVVSLLLRSNANVNKKGIRGDAPIHISVSNCGLDVVTELIFCNADVNVLNNEHETALHIACKQNRVDMIDILLEYATNLNSVSKANYTPLKNLIEHLKVYTVKTAINLIRCGADCNAMTFDNTQNTSSDTSSSHDSETFSCLEYIFKHYELNFRTQEDFKCLVELIEIIIESGYKLNLNEVNLIKTLPLFHSRTQLKRFELVSHYRTPRSLVNLCRIKVRSTLRKPFAHSIQCLHIPFILKELLYFK